MPGIADQTEIESGGQPRIGVLLSNLGTPEAPTAAAIRPYLREFLSDPRVVDLPRVLWWFILNVIILTTRPPRVARLYRKIWTPEGSPLLVTGLQQRDALRRRFDADRFRVALGMRYGKPSIQSALEELLDQDCRRILHLPLYPQYACATTATNHDALFAAAGRGRWMPEIRNVNQYDDDPGYIAALAASVRELWQREGEPARLLISFHGIPERFQTEGDPYPSFCMRTGRLLVRALGLGEDRYAITYQSRFGREPWVRPSTDDTLAEWGRSGLESVDVICPGFSADCLETLEEIDIQYRELFVSAGGGRFRYVPALNAREDHIDALAGIVERHSRGWVE
jgi:ferrochelatase